MRRIIANLAALALVVTALIALPDARAAQRQGVMYELGADVFSTLPRSFGYQWYAAGYIFPPGTYAQREPCERPDPTKAVGTYAIYGINGNQARHQAIYRITVGGESYFFSGEVLALDEFDQPLTSLFNNVMLKVNGLFVQEDPPTEATYTPRSTQCFGGRLMLFKGQAVEARGESLDSNPKQQKLTADLIGWPDWKARSRS